MTLIVFAFAAFISVWAENDSARYRQPDNQTALMIAAAIAGFFGLCGMAMGSGYHRSARQALTLGLGVSELPLNHPLTKRVHDLAAKLDLPPPSVAMMRTANAYAIGSSPEDAAVVLGIPLIKHLSPEELDAVIGHELGHIVSGDMRRMQFAEGYQQMFVSVFTTIANAIVQAVAKTRTGAQLGYAIGNFGRHTVFLVSELAVKQTSRKREYVADAIGAVLTSPAAMQGALHKIHNLPRGADLVEKRYQSLMFCGFGGGGSLFGTHPSLGQRLSALESGRQIEAIMRRAAGAPPPTALTQHAPQPRASIRQAATQDPAAAFAGYGDPRRDQAPAFTPDTRDAPNLRYDDPDPPGVVDVLYDRLLLITIASFITGIVGGMAIF